MNIVKGSEKVNWLDKDIDNKVLVSFPVPKGHPRFSQIAKYNLVVGSLKNFATLETDLILIDAGIQDYVSKDFNKDFVKFLEPSESKSKTLDSVRGLLGEFKGKDFKRVIAIGGGIIINVSAYIAEQLKTDLILFPTTLIAMSDASIGGKVRINDIKDGKFIKHAYKSFYEPNEIVLDPNFLAHISGKWINVGLAEIIKHALYQSEPLTNYLLSNDFDPRNKEDLLRAILWTADLKRICLEIDPEESRDGSYLILRAGHDISDRLEEASGFSLDHGEAVEKAMMEDLANDPRLKTLKAIYTKIGI